MLGGGGSRGGRGGRARRGGRGADRLPYLTQLLQEFHSTTSYDAKCQVLANLSNFAYDPSNYEHLRQIGAINVFVKHLQDSDETLVHFACSAICNLSLDPLNAKYILNRDGVRLLTNLLSSKSEEVTLNAITSLMFLADSDHRIAGDEAIARRLLILKDSTNPRIVNVASVFLEDVCKCNVGISENINTTLA